MTQHFIRKLAGYGPIKRAWMALHEPRWVSAIYGALYTAMTVFGALSTINPPLTIGAAAGQVFVLLISAILTLAGVVGIISVATGAYWAERYAVILAGLAILGYGITTSWLAVTADGYRWWPLMLITGTSVALAVRPAWIWTREYSPKRKHRHQ